MRTPRSDNWTRDSDGNPVDWTSPPFRSGNIVSLVLPGENPDVVGRGPLALKRIDEYYAIVRKQARQSRRL